MEKILSKITEPTKPSPLFSVRYAWYVVFLLASVNFINYMDRMLLAILLPSIKSDLLLSDTQLGLLTGFAFALFYATFGLPIARWADRGIRRDIISLALIVWSSMTALSGAAQNFVHLLLARIGVGAGEAGCIPPSQSIIADYIPVVHRSSALALHTAGATIGVIVGLALGGWLSTQIGWRYTFLIMGLPGIVMAVVVRLTLIEPPRGHSDGHVDTAKVHPLKNVIVYLWSCRSYVQLVLIFALTSFISFGLSQWLPSFYIRFYELTTSEVGLLFGFAFGLGATLGTVGGGFISDHLSAKYKHWPLLLGMVAYIIAIPVGFTMLLMSSPAPALLLNFLFIALVSLPNGVLFAMINSVVVPRMRALAVATNMFFASIVGIGGGPFFVGIMSDLLAPVYGNESLRYAMLVSVCFMAWPVYHFHLAAKSIDSDLNSIHLSRANC